MGDSKDNLPNQTIKADRGGTIQNVIQAIINLPPWALVISSVIFCTAAIAVASIYNVGPLRKLLPPPLEFPKAKAGESLIIVANFDNQSEGKYTGIDPSQYVFEQLKTQVQKDILNIRVERLHQVVDENSSKLVGANYNATLVVWGWYDTLNITPRITPIKTTINDPYSQQDLRLSLPDPNSNFIAFNQIITTDLPSQTDYLVMFSLALDKYLNKNYEEAIAYFNDAMQYGKDASLNLSVVYRERGNVYLDEKEYDKAIADYTEAISQNPNDPDAFYDRGLAYLDKGDFDNSIKDSTISIDKKREADAYNNRGYAYFNKGENKLAEADYNEAINLDPTYVTVYFNRGLLYDKKGDYDKAIKDYSTIIDKIKPDTVYYAYYDRANDYYLLGNASQAIDDLNTAIKLKSDYADAYNYRGHIYADKGDDDSAFNDFDKAIQLNPGYAGAYFNRGVIYVNKRDYNNAIADYAQAIKLQPDYAEAYNNRGNAYGANGSFDLAIADFTQAIHLKPDYVDAYYNRGFAYYNKGDYDLAIADFTQDIQLNPDDAYAYLERGFVYENAGNNDQANTDYGQAILLNPDYGLAYNNRCWLKYELGQYQIALPDCETAIKLEPDNSNFLDSRGFVYEALGRKDDAIKDFEHILEITTDQRLRQRATDELARLKGK